MACITTINNKQYSDKELFEYMLQNKEKFDKYVRLKSVFNQGTFSKEDDNIYYQNLTNQSDEDYAASEKTIRDLAERMSDRIGIEVKFENDKNKKYKGKLENNTAYINLAYATLDTPIHEILGHPIIRVILKNNKTLYNNLLKELETGKGKEVFDRIKRDYNIKDTPLISLLEKYKGLKLRTKTFGKDVWIELEHYGTSNELRDAYNDNYTQGNKDLLEAGVNENWITIDNNFIKKVKELNKYTLEEQQEEAIVELVSLMTAEKLDKVKDGKLISLLKRLLKEMKQFVRSLINQREVEINKLPDNMTLGDLADLLAYSNSKLILPGYEVIYTTPDNQQFKTYIEASKHISELAKSVKDVDLNNVKVNTTPFTNEESLELDYLQELSGEKSITEEQEKRRIGLLNKSYNQLLSFIDKNKEYEQSKEIIEEWKKVNNIQYNPEEVYSRGEIFIHRVGAFSQDYNIDLMLQNYLAYLEDYGRISDAEFVINAITRKPDERVSFEDKSKKRDIRIKIVPKSEDIKWVGNIDMHSGSTWDYHKYFTKVGKERAGIGATKSPSLSNINSKSIAASLAESIENKHQRHSGYNEIGLRLTGDNFRFEYDEDIPYQTKKLLDSLNKILDERFGKLVKPNISTKNTGKVVYRVGVYFNNTSIAEFNSEEEAQNFINKYKQENANMPFKEDLAITPDGVLKGIQPTQTNETLKESIESVRNKLGLTKNKEHFRHDEFSIGDIVIVKGYEGKYKIYELERTEGEIGVPVSEIFFNLEPLENEFDPEINPDGLHPLFNVPTSALELYKDPNKKEKEYTEQALINTKIAKLKEVAKKYPRSLIRSEVKSINNTNLNYGFENNELPFQKIQNENKLLTEYDKKLLNVIDELNNDNIKEHNNTKTNIEMLNDKIKSLNENQNKIHTYLNQNNNKILIGIIQLNKNEQLLNKYNELDFNENKVSIRNRPSTEKNYNFMQEKLLEMNKDNLEYKFIIEKNGNNYNFNVKINDKLIDDIISTIKNYEVIEKEIPSFDKTFKKEIEELGLDITKKIYNLINRNLIDNEIIEFKDKYNDYKPSDNYDDNKNIDITKNEEFESAVDFENINDYIEDIYNTNNIDNLKIDAKVQDKNIKESLYTLFDDFIIKLTERKRLLQKKYDNANKSEKKNLFLELQELDELIKSTPKENMNIWTILNYLENDINDLNNKLKNKTITEDNLNYYNNILDLWDIILLDWRENTSSKFYKYLKDNINFQMSAIKYNGIIQELKSQLLDINKTVTIQTANKYMNKALQRNDLNSVNEINKVTQQTLDLSRNENMITQSIFKMLNTAEQIKTLNFNKFSQQFDKLIKKMNDNGYDLTKKDVQELFFEHENGINLGTLISNIKSDYYNERKDLHNLYKKINRIKKNKSSLSDEIRKLEDKLFTYVDINELVDDNKMLLKNKLIDLKTQLLKQYSPSLVDNIIQDIKDKHESFIEDSLIYKEHLRNRIMIDKEYENIRKKSTAETDEDVNTRIEMVINEKYNSFYSRTNPYTYIQRRNNSSSILDGQSYKYLTELPKDDYINKDFKKIENTPILSEFYNFYKDNLKRLIEVLPFNVTDKIFENYIPKIQKELLEGIKGLGDIGKELKQQFIENSTVSLNTIIEHTNAMGKEIAEIPIRYIKQSTSELDYQIKKLIESNKIFPIEGFDKQLIKLTKLREQSQNNYTTDVVVMLKQFSIMAENYNAYSKIEDSILAAKNILDNIKILNNNSSYNKTTKIDEKGAELLKKQTDYTIKALMYQQKKEHRMIGNKLIFKDNDIKKEYDLLYVKLKKNKQDYVLKKVGYFEYLNNEYNIEKEIKSLFEIETPKVRTTDKIVDTVIQIAGITGLSWNVKSAVNNLVFGKVSLMIHGAGKQDFDNHELHQAFSILNDAMLLDKNQTKVKVKNISEIYNVVFEMNEAAYGSKSTKETKTNKLDLFKSYGMSRKGEYYLQNAGMIAILLHTKIKVKDKITNKESEISLWDAYNSEGNFKNNNLYYNENTNMWEETLTNYNNNNIDIKNPNNFIKLMQHIEQMNKEIHGNYDPRSPIMAKATEIGRLLAQYKTWMPEGIAQRFQKEQWDDMLNRTRKGRYISHFEVGLFKAFGMYIKAFFNNKNISENDFSKSVDYANMMQNLVEFRFMVVIALSHLMLRLIIQSIGRDNDDWKLRSLRTLLNQLSRLDGDLNFYLNPMSAITITKNLAPAIQYVGKWLIWINNAKKLFVPGYKSDTYDIEQWAKSGMKQVPILNEYYKWQRDMEKLNEQ